MFKESKIYYKVVGKNLDSYGFTCGFLPGSFNIKYKIGEWVEPPPGMDLFVFDNLNDAKSFRPNSDFVIFGVNVRKPRKKGLFRQVGWGWTREQRIDILNTWTKRRLQKKKFINENKYEQPPKGTIFCRSVKLIKQVI